MKYYSVVVVVLSIVLLNPYNPAPASARTASTTIAVSATVIPSCTVVSSGSLDFGQVAVSASQVVASSQISFSCTQNTTGRIGIDGGLNATGTQRQLQQAPHTTIPYSLWQDPAHTISWGSADPNRLTFTANPPRQSRSIYGVLQVPSTAQPGQYTDAITVTIEF